MKRTLKEEEAMSSDVVAQVHIEDVALRLFKHADEQDRAARFDRWVTAIAQASFYVSTGGSYSSLPYLL